MSSCGISKYWVIMMAGSVTALSAPPATAPRPVVLRELLSSCVDACGRGCAAITAVEANGVQQTRLKVDGDARSVQTEADTQAQLAIVSSLRAQWPGLKIVGEEDEDDVGSSPAKPLRLDLCPEASAQTLAVEDVVVFVDPLDGTREFVDGNLDAVQTLLGVSVRGRPIAGVAGLPFSQGSIASYEESMGLKWHGEVPASYRAQSVELVTGDSSDEVMGVAVKAALGVTRRVVGATGNKLLAVMGGNRVAVLHRKTYAWDTCGWEAAITGSGGLVTDYFGSPLCCYASYEMQNKLGVVASLGCGEVHQAICRAMRSDPVALALLSQTQPHAADVALDLDGRPLDVAGLASRLGGGLLSYCAPEEDAVRGALSTGCRLRLQYENKTTSVFYKRVVMRELSAARQKAVKQPVKLKRDVESFRVEAEFLRSAACRKFSSRESPRLPEVLHAELRPSSSPLESKFCLYLGDFSEGWIQRCLLDDPGETRSALRALARFHAFFWRGSQFYENAEDVSELEAAVWPAGGHWQPAFQSPEQLTTLVASEWPALLDRFESEFKAAGLDVAKLKTLGARLQKVDEQGSTAWFGGGESLLAHRVQCLDIARRTRRADPRKDSNDPADPKVAAAVGDEAHPSASRGKTLIHGDLKAANIFVRGAEVALIDFQFVGFGLAATDLAHFLCCAVGAGPLLELDELLDCYHEALCGFASDYGVSDVISRATLQAQFETAVLDMCRLVLAYQWPRIAASPDNLKRHSNVAARNSYNKRIQNAIWIVSTCDALLDKRAA